MSIYVYMYICLNMYICVYVYMYIDMYMYMFFVCEWTHKPEPNLDAGRRFGFSPGRRFGSSSWPCCVEASWSKFFEREYTGSSISFEGLYT